jgi:futalosine hydrolase
MKQLLLAAATAAEIGPFLDHLAPFRCPGPENRYQTGNYRIDVCITGVGMMAAAFRLGQVLSTGSFDLAIQAGIAGSFDRSIPLGSLAAVVSELQGDLGAEDREQYLDIFSLGFADKDTFPFSGGQLRNTALPDLAQGLPLLSSMTVNTVSGHQPTIDARSARFGCSLESMEGAAFHYACLMTGTPFLQLRAVSNYVEPRNRAAWQIGAAIHTLNDFLLRHLGNTNPEPAPFPDQKEQ